MSRGRHWTPYRRSTFVAACLGTVVGLRAVAWGAGVVGPPHSYVDNSPVTFSVTGDAPYGDAEVPEFQQQLDDHNLYSSAAFFVHVGDIFAGSDACAEFRYQRMADQLRTLAVPAFIVPGDNETVDCLDPNQGWQYWESHLLGIDADFCGGPFVERQNGREENFAFVHSGVLFIGIHLVGASNSTSLLQDDADWAEQQLQQKGGAVRAAVLFAQEGPEAGTLFWNQFESDVASFAKPVLVVHGDGHSWILDNPFSQPNMTRVQVERGDEPPVHITVTMDPQNPFEFEQDPWPSGTPTVNTPVCVNAGSNISISGPGTTVLRGVVKDDGLNNGSASPWWSVINAPGSVAFGAQSSPTSTVTLGAPGTYVLRLSADDGQFSDADDVSIFVGDQPNEAPVVQNEAYQTDEDVTLARSAPGVLQNDSDADGDNLTASVSVWPTRGTLSLSANGAFSYTPNLNVYGSDSFSYNVSDGRGGVDTGLVSITILPVNDAPLAVVDAYDTPYSEVLTVAAPGVLRNDSDVEGDPIFATLVSPPAHGSLFLESDGSLTYQPDGDFAGWDSFTYAGYDGAAMGAPATVQLGVGVSVFTPIDDATVRANQWKKNFGSQPTLEVRATNKPYHSYVKFAVNGVEDLRAAKLRLYVNGSASDVGQVHLVSNEYETSGTAWDENGIKWENAPGLGGTPLDAGGGAGDDTWIEFDVTEAVQNGILSFGLQNGSSSLVSFSSKEGAHAPELAIAWAPQASNAQVVTPANLENTLWRIYPNPSRGGTWIEYQLVRVTDARLRIYNARGQRVRGWRSVAGPGTNRFLWDGRDDQGRKLASGVYFLQLELGERRFQRKVLLER